MIAVAPCQYGWRARTTNPLSKINAPLTQDHNGFARKSVNSVGISAARATAVQVRSTRKGPITRANMRVLVWMCCEELMSCTCFWMCLRR